MLTHARVTLSALLLICLSLTASTAPSAAATVLYLGDHFPDTSTAFSDRLLRDVRASGFRVDVVNGSQLRERLDGESGPGSILLMPNAPYLPADAKGSVQGFLKRGNHLLAISGPALGKLVVRVGDDWLTSDQAKQSLLKQPGHPIAEFSAKTIGDWERSTASPSNRTTFGVEPSGDPRVPSALHMRIPRLDDWEVLMGKPGLAYPGGCTAMTFWAKGGKGAPELMVQWYERDGSRWFVSVKLTPEWKQYVLTADDFAYWYGGPEGKRGKPGDVLHPENADKLTFGLADGMSKQPMKKPHEFWVAGFQAVRNPYAEIDFISPILESISPTYKTYRTSASRLQESHSSTVWNGRYDLCCPVPRTMGFGCESLRPNRMIPLMEAYDADSTRRGIAAHYYLNTSGPYAGSVWGYLGLDQSALSQRPGDASRFVVRMLRGIEDGVFLANAGTDRIAYAAGETTRFGGCVVNLRQSPVNALVRITVSSRRPLKNSCIRVVFSPTTSRNNALGV